MIDFRKHNQFLPLIAWRLNILPIRFDTPSFVDVYVERMYYIDKYYVTFKYRRGVDNLRHSMHAIVFQLGDPIDQEVTDTTISISYIIDDPKLDECTSLGLRPYECCYRDLLPIFMYWKDFINDTFYTILNKRSLLFF